MDLRVFNRRYWMRFHKWARYAAGNSYQHVPQGVGRAFVPGALQGYFNDLTGKAGWTGATGRFGVPLVKTDTAEKFAFPIVIFQWALGNWDLSLLEADRSRLEPVLAAAKWAREAMTSEGGWACWTGLRRPTTSVYSAMAQGQGLSVLSRAAVMDPGGGWLDVADKAYRFMMESPGSGLLRVEGGIHYLEEYPGRAMQSVLNGWLFSLVGIYDYSLAKNDSELRGLAVNLARDLSTALHQYDTGFWSSYDLSGNIASPFYHRLHIAQLRAAADLFPEEGKAFNAQADRFAAYSKSRINTARAIFVKIIQKLRQADVGEMN
jgi:hypothetical protein